jgi:hypothetical protein
MSLYVRIVDGQVTDCWDTPPPEGQEGWKNAIEVRPTIIPNRQSYVGHTFDLTKDPVEIVYGTFDIAVDDRKEQMKMTAQMEFNRLFRQQAENPSTFDPTALQAAKDAIAPKQQAIDACTTHDELDAI